MVEVEVIDEAGASVDAFDEGRLGMGRKEPMKVSSSSSDSTILSMRPQV